MASLRLPGNDLLSQEGRASQYFLWEWRWPRNHPPDGFVCGPSIISPGGLNFRVRDTKRYGISFRPSHTAIEHNYVAPAYGWN